MKNSILIMLLSLFIFSCTSNKNIVSNPKINETKTSDTIRITNKDLEYEVIIIEPGFNTWLATQAQPRGFYSESYLENKNRFYVSEYNNRVMQPFKYNSNLYENQINYNFNVHYGYEVNYLIYNYLIFFQQTYKQKLAGYVPRN